MIAARASPRAESAPSRCDGTNRTRDLLQPTLLYCERIEKAGTAEINGRTLEVSGGDCFVLPAGSVVHDDTWLNFDRAVVLHRAEAGTVAFVNEFPRDAALGIGRVTVPIADRRRWGDRLERLQYEMTAQAPRSREAAQALLTLLAVDAARYVGCSVPTALPPRRVVAEVFRHINEHLAAPISLRDIANAVNFSPAYLTDLMKRETGRPIVSWIIELRMQRAEHLLAQTDQPISQIAATVGYGDANSFGRAFTKRRGVSPWQWRRRLQFAARSASIAQ
jgi:AraC-like DNA-binding protein